MPYRSIGSADIWLENHALGKLKSTAVLEYERMMDANLRPCLGEIAAALVTMQDFILKVRDLKVRDKIVRVHADHVVPSAGRLAIQSLTSEAN